METGEASGASVTGDRYHGFVFDPAHVAEDVDVDVDRRKEILWTEAQLPRATHWELLGIPWNAPPEAAKAAYVEKVKVFHPDRFAGKRLGSYRGRLERVFQRLTEARDVLVDGPRREGYVRATAPPEEFARLEARRLGDERRAEERRARLARNNPLLARASRTSEHVARGKQALADGKPGQAANELALAQALDPQNAEIARLATEARRRAGAQRAAEAYDRGLEAELAGRWTTALAAFREAHEADPAHGRAAAHAARAAVESGDVAGARGLALAAVKAAPRLGVVQEALALVLEAEGDRREAKRALERALELDPKLELAKERLKKLRWSFLG